jgi:hypothetical protein
VACLKESLMVTGQPSKSSLSPCGATTWISRHYELVLYNFLKCL